MAIYVNVTQFITGTGNHHDPRMMRVKFGNLVRTLLNNVGTARDNMEAFKKGMKIKQSDVRKFTAYSTVGSLLPFASICDAALVAHPPFRELLSSPGCVRQTEKEKGGPNFKSCCADYESDPGAGCLSKTRKLRRSIREDPNYEPLFAGPA
ncbi:hypothetical protein CAEBREN_07072 [Caenorhabditis brenneri]|uniref:Uncharacterized protein n=1 Tax=Caenorhabditis brenneri TaxID=135651 RepID=G0NFI1_CAEBE|nr:hypothetical protein CAEBREN_07072 [Caenorhabditis brenneri]